MSWRAGPLHGVMRGDVVIDQDGDPWRYVDVILDAKPRPVVRVQPICSTDRAALALCDVDDALVIFDIKELRRAHPLELLALAADGLYIL